MNPLNSFLCVFLFAISFPASGQTVHFVNIDVPGGSQDGSSWENAFSNLNHALDEAEYGDQVWVAQGTYRPTNGFIRDVAFFLKNGVQLFGGFDGTESTLSERDWDMNPTILSGDIGVPGDSTDNSFTILLIEESDTTTRMDGFTLRHGVANGILGEITDPNQSGGAIHIDGGTTFAHPRIHNCRFENNFARNDGGAVYIGGWFNGSFTPQFHHCFFTQNRCLERGASIARIGSSELDIDDDFFDCVFENNFAEHDGGGIFIQERTHSDTVEIINCRFSGNTATLQGAGISIWGSTPDGSRISVRQCEFENNLAVEAEGSDFHFVTLNLQNIDFIEIDECTFQSARPGSEQCIYMDAPSFPLTNTRIKVTDCTFKDNLATLIFLTGYEWDSIIIENNLFENNRQDGSLFQMDNALNCRIVNNSFVKNGPIGNNPVGCRIFQLSLIDQTICANNIFFDNHLRFDGLLRSSGIDTLTNCLIWNHLDTMTNNIDFSLPQSVHIQNSIIFVDELFGSFETLGATHIYLENTAVTHPGCPVLPDPPSSSDPYPPFVFCGNGMLFDPVPLLADTAAGDYSLDPCSPARNAGENSFLTTPNLSTDILGNPRIEEGNVDLGPFEVLSFELSIDNLTDSSCENGDDSGTLVINAQSACAPFTIEYGDTTIVANASPIVLENLPMGNFHFTLTDAQGRVDEATVEIILSNTLTVEAFPSSEVDCETGSTVNATAIYSGGTGKVGYAWSTGSSSAWIINQPIGNYAVTVTDAIGCTAVDTFEIIGNGSLEIFGEAENVTCPDGSDGSASATAVMGSPPFSWSWENTVINPTLSDLPIGEYAVTVTDAIGCSGETTVEISEPAPLEVVAEVTHSTSTSNPNGSIQIIQTTGGNGGFSFSWSTGETTPAIENLPDGEYALTLTDAEGCEEIFTFTVELNVGLEQTLGDAQIKVFPNPASSNGPLFLQIDGEESTPISARFYDTHGRVIFSEKMVSQNSSPIFRMPNVRGLYLLELENEKRERAAFRIVVE